MQPARWLLKAIESLFFKAVSTTGAEHGTKPPRGDVMTCAVIIVDDLMMYPLVMSK